MCGLLGVDVAEGDGMGLRGGDVGAEEGIGLLGAVVVGCGLDGFYWGTVGGFSVYCDLGDTGLFIEEGFEGFVELFRAYRGLDFEETAVHAFAWVVGLLEAEDCAVFVLVGGVAVCWGDGLETVVVANV